MDIIVGFPGEDDDAFEETYRFIEEMPLYYLHVFPYSPREGTRAAAMEDQVLETGKEDKSRSAQGSGREEERGLCPPLPREEADDSPGRQGRSIRHDEGLLGELSAGVPAFRQKA